MKFLIGTRIWASLASIFLILLILGGASYRNTRGLTETAQRVTHTHVVITDLEDLLSTLQDAETGQRGYLITGEERYLGPYRDALRTLDSRIGALRELTRDNAAQQQRLAALGPLVTAKLAELKESIDLRRSKGFDAARKIVATDRGKQQMDDIRKLIDDMKAEEQSLLKRRDEEARASSHSLFLMLIGGTLLAAALVAIAGLLLTRSLFRMIGKLGQEMRESADVLAASIVEAAQAATQIAASSQQQMVGMDQVALAMDSIKQASLQNVSSTKQAESAAHNLSESGQRLISVLEQYRI